MSVIAEAVRQLMELGVSGERLVTAIERLENAAARSSEKDVAAEKRRAYDRERKRAKTVSTGIPPENAETKEPPVPPEFHRNSTGNDAEPRAHVRDITSSTVDNIKLSLSLERVRECAGDAMASMATCPGLATLHPLNALLTQPQPCTIDEVYDGITRAAAWHRAQDGPESMRSWKLAVKIANENRDARLSPAVVQLRPDHERPNRPASPALARREANLERSFAGSEIAIARRAERREGG